MGFCARQLRAARPVRLKRGNGAAEDQKTREMLILIIMIIIIRILIIRMIIILLITVIGDAGHATRWTSEGERQEGGTSPPARPTLRDSSVPGFVHASTGHVL